jgi:hypothetical protein
MLRIQNLCSGLYNDILSEEVELEYDPNDERTVTVIKQCFITLNPVIQESNLQEFAGAISTATLNVSGEKSHIVSSIVPVERNTGTEIIIIVAADVKQIP